MPEKGWAILTVREATAKRIKEITHNGDLTVDELINELLSPSDKAGWFTCSTCGAKIKAKNRREHMLKVHPKALTSQRKR